MLNPKALLPPTMYLANEEEFSEFIQSIKFEAKLPAYVNRILGKNGAGKKDCRVDDEVHSFARNLADRSPQATLVIDQLIRETVQQHGFRFETDIALSQLIPDLVEKLTNHKHKNFHLKIHKPSDFSRHWEDVLLNCYLYELDIDPVSSTEGSYSDLIRYLIQETAHDLSPERVILNIHKLHTQN